MKIAVTGASGLLGSNLVRLLCGQGYQVVCSKREGSRVSHLQDLPLTWVEAGLEDRERLLAGFRGAKVLFHCAALVEYAKRKKDDIIRTNVGGTQTIIEVAKALSVERFVHCSSVDAFGLPENQSIADETTPWNWDALGLDYAYPRSKYEAQRLVVAAARELDVVIVNPTFMIGPYDMRPSSGMLVLQVARELVPFHPSGTNNFVDVRDVCRGMMLALQHGRRGEAYILGGKNMSYADFFTLVRQAQNRFRHGFALPRAIARMAGIVGDMYSCVSTTPSLINSEICTLGYLNHSYSSEKAIQELAYRPNSLERAIADTLAFFCESGALSRSSFS